MFKNLISASNKFYEDQALIFLTFGGFGRYVLSILDAEFKRLGIPEDKFNFLAFDTEKPHRDRLDLAVESEYFIHLEEFDGDVYVENRENEELRNAVNHVPMKYLRDIEGGCKGVPAVGFVAFHKYDDLLVTRESLRLIDEVRAKNPGKKVKLILISGMGGSVSNGMTVPFLYRIRNRLKEKRIRVEVYLATSEGYTGLQNVQEFGVERNCIASAMLWEYAIAGKNGLTYPGKDGVRDQRMFDGRIAHRTYAFSGGSAETSLKYQAMASIIAQCISTLEMTKVGSYLDGDRVNYAAHILEREWTGKNGQTHPTGLMTMNVAGLKGDCLPQLYHFHMVKKFIGELLKSLAPEKAEKIRGDAISCFLENNLNEDDIRASFSIEIPSLTRETINQENVSEENVYGFLKNKIVEMQNGSVEKAEKNKQLEEASMFMEKVILRISEKGDNILASSGHYCKGALLFYEKLDSLLETKMDNVHESIIKIEKDLFEGGNRKTMSNLMDKLEAVTKKKNVVGAFVASIGQSPILSLVNQILDIASKIQQQKKEKYNHLLLLDIYNSLHKFLQDKKEGLKKEIYLNNKLISEIDHEAEKIKRIGRSAFIYNKSKYDDLMEHIMEKLDANLDGISIREVLTKMESLLPKGENHEEKDYIEALLGIVKPDTGQLTGFVDDLFCRDKKVLDYLQIMLDQFFLTLKLDRDRFPTLETSQSCFVMCTRKFFDKYKDEFFEGYTHIETENPYNILVTKHEEGFPFIAMSYIHRINESFKELRNHGKSSLGHIMASLETKLPLLDD